jgi:hypothetical protein
MKTNSSAHATVKIIMGCLLIAALVVIEYEVGKSLVSRIGWINTTRTDIPQVPPTDVSDLMAAR